MCDLITDFFFCAPSPRARYLKCNFMSFIKQYKAAQIKQTSGKSVLMKVSLVFYKTKLPVIFIACLYSK